MKTPILPTYSLNHALPPGIRVGSHNFFTRYKDYPVFSWPWWWRRVWMFLLFGFVLVLFPTFSGWLAVSDPGAAALVALYTYLAAMLLVNLGPGLASLVRHRRFPVAREKVAVLLAILISAGIAYLANDWLRDLCDQVLQPYEEARKLSAERSAEKSILALVTSTIFFGLFGGLWAMSAYIDELRRWRDSCNDQAALELKAQKQQAELRLSVLQAQVEPHFLFNTLASVRAQMRHDPAQSEATLDALVDYLRASIPRLRDSGVAVESTLGQQLDLCASYLEVMRLRTAGRLQYGIEADARVRAMPFPPMLLITLVENAIKHGVEPKPGPGQVTIAATYEAGSLDVSVTDDGVGLQLGLGAGLGLANVRAQLETLYGGHAGFDLRSMPVRGARAELRIPSAGSAV